MLTDRHQNCLSKYIASLNELKRCIIQNDTIVNCIICDVSAIFINIPSSKIDLPERAGDSDISDNETNNGQECINASVKSKTEDIEKVSTFTVDYVGI